MPEGPEIHRAADRLDAVLAGEPLRQVVFGLEHLRHWEPRLRGRRVCEVEARGKAMLIRLEGGLWVYSHNQLYGRWEIVTGHALPESRRQLRLALHTDTHVALLYSASEIAVLDGAGMATHPYLSRLGPDLLDPLVDVDQVAARLGDPRWRRRALMRLLQDQSVLAGMGNYLACEVLHLAGLLPCRRIQELDPKALRELARQCLAVTHQSYQTGGITNDLRRAEALRGQGVGFEALRFHVYRREGLPCYRCGVPIERHRFNGQPCFLCPSCQT
jgi:endonuclease-8